MEVTHLYPSSLSQCLSPTHLSSSFGISSAILCTESSCSLSTHDGKIPIPLVHNHRHQRLEVDRIPIFPNKRVHGGVNVRAEYGSRAIGNRKCRAKTVTSKRHSMATPLATLHCGAHTPPNLNASALPTISASPRIHGVASQFKSFIAMYNGVVIYKYASPLQL